MSLRLCALVYLLDGVAVAAGAVLDAAVDAADGGSADLHGLYDLVVGAAAEQELGRFQTLGHIGDLLDRAEVFEEVVALLPRLKTQDRVEQCVGGGVSSGVLVRHSCLLQGKVPRGAAGVFLLLCNFST